MDEFSQIKELFISVFTRDPWNDDWSDGQQLDLYLTDLIGQNNSLTYGLYDGDALIALSLGRIKHWFTGTEYCIDEFCVRTDRQQNGVGTCFLAEMQTHLQELGMTHIYLQTESDVPAYMFYQKNGFKLLFSTEEQEKEYRNISSAHPLETRLMFFDLIRIFG